MAKIKKGDMDRVCHYCENAQTLNNPDKMLCSFKGVVSGAYCCKKFIYDPLKRDPKPVDKLPGLNPEDLLL